MIINTPDITIRIQDKPTKTQERTIKFHALLTHTCNVSDVMHDMLYDLVNYCNANDVEQYKLLAENFAALHATLDALKP